VRLTRAFYHLELYSLLFRSLEISQDTITAYQQCQFFLFRLPDWEIEKLLCVRQFLLDSLTSFLDLSEGESFSSYPNRGAPPSITTEISNSRFRKSWDFFSEKAKKLEIQEQWLEDILFGGVGVIREIAQAEKGERGGLLRIYNC
jgi:hypothetical protein